MSLKLPEYEEQQLQLLLLHLLFVSHIKTLWISIEHYCALQSTKPPKGSSGSSFSLNNYITIVIRLINYSEEVAGEGGMDGERRGDGSVAGFPIVK